MKKRKNIKLPCPEIETEKLQEQCGAEENKFILRNIQSHSQGNSVLEKEIFGYTKIAKISFFLQTFV